jgi:hypothetical protein
MLARELRGQFGHGRTIAPCRGIAGAIEALMVAAANMVEIAALVGDTARATSRAVRLTPTGRRGLRDTLGIDTDDFTDGPRLQTRR